MAQYEKFAITAQRLTGIADRPAACPNSRIAVFALQFVESRNRRKSKWKEPILLGFQRGESYDF